MAANDKTEGEPFTLNEPRRTIRGGRRRKSVRVRDAALAVVRRRDRLNRTLQQHDGDAPIPSLSTKDIALLRRIAREGAAANHVPAIRRGAILLLAQAPVTDNLALLTELATRGEDIYVRSHALIALGTTGLTLAAPLLLGRLAAEDRTERQAAGIALRLLARRAGADIWRDLAEGPLDAPIRAALRRLEARAGDRNKRPAPSRTASRPKAPARR